MKTFINDLGLAASEIRRLESKAWSMRARTDRQQLRDAMLSGWSLDCAQMNNDRGLFSDGAMKRFFRLWVYSTATEHPYTRGKSLEFWIARRNRCRAAIGLIIN